MVLNIHFFQTRPYYIVPKSAPILIENWSVWVNPGQSKYRHWILSLLKCYFAVNKSSQIIPYRIIHPFHGRLLLEKKLYDVDMSH